MVNGSFTTKRYAFVRPYRAMPLAEAVMSVLPSATPSTDRAQWLIDWGAIYVNQIREIDPNREVNPGDCIRVHWDPRRYHITSEILEKRIHFENDDFIIVDKPSGVPVHATLDNLRENVLWMLSQSRPSVRLTHRLDVLTSGLLVVAKTAAFQRRFNRILSNGLVEKTYTALTLKALSAGLYRHWMLKSVRAPKILRCDSPEPAALSLWDECLLEVINAEKADDIAKHQIRLHTGRTHQIRGQLASLGAPIIGDTMYGGVNAKLDACFEQFGLRATGLKFSDPSQSSPEKNYSFDIY